MGFKNYHIFSEPLLYGLVLGLTINYLRIMVNAISQSDFFAYHCGTVIALSFGLMEVAIREEIKERGR
jgi:hypothetical protein